MMRITAEELAAQAVYEARRYMAKGMVAIAEEFNVKYLSKEHVELCKALLPGFMAAAAEDFKGCVLYGIEETLRNGVSVIKVE